LVSMILYSLCQQLYLIVLTTMHGKCGSVM
jgi:hypothetical protein